MIVQSEGEKTNEKIDNHKIASHDETIQEEEEAAREVAMGKLIRLELFSKCGPVFLEPGGVSLLTAHLQTSSPTRATTHFSLAMRISLQLSAPMGRASQTRKSSPSIREQDKGKTKNCNLKGGSGIWLN